MAHSPTIADAKELIKFSADAYGTGGPIPPGWSAIAIRYDPTSGLKVIAFRSIEDPTRVVVAIAGTQFGNGAAIDTDSAVLGNNFPKNFDDALRAFLEQVTDELPNTTQIAVTGHSLGGFGTQLAVPYLIDAGFANTYGVTFGALGAGDVASEAHFNSPPSAYADSILNIVNAGDPVGTLKSQIGTVVRIGEQGPVWRALDIVTDILFPLGPLYFAGAIEAFHGLDQYRSLLERVPAGSTLPPMLLDPALDTAENSALVESAIQSLRDATGALLDPTVAIDITNFGQAYVLLPGEAGDPAELLTIPADGPSVGLFVGIDRDGQPNLTAPAGAVMAVQGLEDGGARLRLNPGLGFELESIEIKSDGAGLLRPLQGPPTAFDHGAMIWLGGPEGTRLGGSETPDVEIGGSGDDTLLGVGGDDQLSGGGGSDTLDGGRGADRLKGGSGDDRLNGGSGNDTLSGESGNDTMSGGAGGDSYVFDGRGNDVVSDVDLSPVNGDADRIVVDPSIAPDHVDVFYAGHDLILRTTDGDGGSLRVKDGLAGQDGDSSPSIELVEFANGTTWTLPALAARARPLPPGDPLSTGGAAASPAFVTLSAMTASETALSRISGLFDDARTVVSPIILDLDGNGVETVSAAEGGHFDHDGNGFAERTGWVAEGDGLLVWDRDGNGRIDIGKELFGDRTLLRDGVTRASNGFQALASWDEDADGRISAGDALWAHLQVWQDRDGDGVSTPDELVRLNDVGITSIGTAYFTATRVDAQGNDHRQLGSFSRVDGTMGAAEDVWFSADTLHTIARNPIALPSDVAALPDLRGTGNVYSLHQAMARDTSGTLRSLVESFASTVDPSSRDAIAEKILFRWTGSDGIDPASRGTLMDARQVATLEAFMGRPYTGYGGSNTPHHTSAPRLREAYRELKELTYAGLMAQTRLADLYGRIAFTWDATGGLTGDLAGVVAELKTRLATDPAAGRTDLAEFARSVRGLQVETAVGYWTFREALLTQDPSLAWVMDSGGRNVVVGTAGADSLTGGLGQDALRGGLGNDWLNGGDGNDALHGDEGADTLWGYDGDDVLSGGVDSDQLNGGNGSDRLEGGEGADNLSGDAGNDVLLGGAGVDRMSGGTGDDILRGGDGDDQLAGNDGADVLDGNAGSDFMQGNLGGDIYLFGRGSGQDTLQENGEIGGAADVIRLGAGVAPADVALRRDGDHLVLSIRGTSDQLTVYYAFGQFSPANEIEAVQFADGTTWDLAQIKATLVQGTAGPDTLVGYLGADTINGLDGNDTIWGAAGNDTLDGGAGADRLYGEAGDDTLVGGAGDDQLNGGADNDVLRGGDGADSLSGTSGADRLDGGPGNDWMDGGTGADVYVFGRGGGQDTIQDSDATPGVVDVIQMDSGIAPADVKLSRNGDSLVLQIAGTSDQLTAYAWFWQDRPDNMVEQIRFADGTVWGASTIKQAVLTGSAGADTLFGYATDDLLQGLSGKDTLWGRAGNDRLDGGAGADTMYGEAGNDTYVVDDPADSVVEALNAGTDTIETALTYSLPANVENLVLTGQSAVNATGNGLGNVLVGNPAANVLDGAAGNDTLKGGLGSDTYRLNPGWGHDVIHEDDSTPGNADTVLFGGTVRPFDLVLRRSGDSLIVAQPTIGDDVTIEGWYGGSPYQTEVIQAGDGSRLLNTQVEGLIQAMASYTSSVGLTWDQALVNRPQEVQTVLAGFWQPHA
ncbi:MAG TPA: calcium-binding protein [Candidatus Bathyarchaeia archaeon]|nr:calcium-binding protein [Candidatus Bathyarchaeia archaeon]